jgi:RNase P/RNase MRP subunit POP5
MKNNLPATRRAAREYLRRKIESKFPQYDAAVTEAIEISILKYLGDGIADDWQPALVKESGDSIDIRTISLIEKAVTLLLDGGAK